MSWTDTFPHLSDDMLEEYRTGVSARERAKIEEWFAIDRIYNLQTTPQIVSFSLFYKHPEKRHGEMTELSREFLQQAKKSDSKNVKRFAPWEHYIEPLIRGAKAMRARRKDVAYRVYLAADMAFMRAPLVKVGCEVFLMKTSSIRHNPGAMWRFLALEEPDRMVTISDSDRADILDEDIKRTESLNSIGLPFWRVPVFLGLNSGKLNYRPILASQFGSVRPLPVKELMAATIWHTRRGSLSTQVQYPGCGPVEIFGTEWPSYGFDEWFLQAALYPRVAKNGILSFCSFESVDRFFPLDIEYTTWANPNSEMVYFGPGEATCCAPTEPERLPKSWRVTQSHFPKPKWRNYNPSVLRFDSKYIMSYRSQPPCDIESTSEPSQIYLCDLAGNLRSTSNHRVVKGLKGEHQEDGRIFTYKGQLHLCYVASRYQKAGGWECSVQLAEITAGGKVKKHYKLEFGVNGVGLEKNWQFFQDGDKLRVCYSVNPHVVFDAHSGEKWGDVHWSWWDYGHFSGGTPPVKVGKYWFSFMHSHKPDNVHNRKYAFGVYAFREVDYKLVSITKKPILVASEEDGFIFDWKKSKWHPLTVFPAGAIYEEPKDRWIVSYGVNDSYSNIMTIPHEYLLSLLPPMGRRLPPLP